MHCTPKSEAVEALGERIGEQLKAEVLGITQRLSAEGGEADALLGWFEQEVMCAMKGVGQSLLAGLCALLVERYAVAEIRCACGGMAVYQRQREGQTRTLFGDVVVGTAVLPVCALSPGALSAGRRARVLCRRVEQWVECLAGAAGHRICL